MSLLDTPLIGQPGPAKRWPYAAIEAWLFANAWAWVSAQSIQAGGIVGGDVQRWDDLTAHNHDWTQNTVANRPTYTPGALNGLPGVEFFNAEHMFNSHSMDEMKAANPDNREDRTLVVMFQSNGADPNPHGIISDTLNDTGDMFINRDVFNQAGSYRFRAAQTSASPSWFEVNSYDTDLHIWACKAVDINFANSGDSLFHFFDGVHVVTAPGKPPSWSTAGSSAIQLGRANVSGNSWEMSGFIFEAIVFNALLTDARIVEITEYLQAKWKVV